MNVKILNESVVIIAEDHNPSILHPFFLSDQSIVPKEWAYAPDLICSPPFSIVRYTNGITFTVENKKFQVMKSPPTPRLKDSEVPECASKYINVLPHVRYTAVGMNFGAILENPDPSTFLVQQFLNKGPWNSGEQLVKGLSLVLVYSADGGILNLSCSPVNTLSDSSHTTVTGIIVNANYHFVLPGHNPLQEAVETIKRFSEFSENFYQVLNRIFGIEE